MRMTALVAFFLCAPIAAGDAMPFLREAHVTALAGEISGETALKTIEDLARHHRMRGSRGFTAATEHIVAGLNEAGLSDVDVVRLAADGTVFYGTQRSRPAWNAEHAELWELAASGQPRLRIAAWSEAPIRLAQDSASADVKAELVDVGTGLTAADYEEKQVKGKLVLVSSQPGAAAPLAIERFGAAGIISYAQNQRTAWWGENEDLIRWGHLETFAPRAFAFMVSPREARSFQKRLADGERIVMHAVVRAGRQAGFYEIATGTIPGNDPLLSKQEIVFSCHLDHPSPGANDNASGCAAILEIARTYSTLIRAKSLPLPRRTIRFIWPAEIEGTLALLQARPEMTRNIKSAIHLDMVGGGPETKAIFHVTRGPASQPSFINDIAEEIGAFVNAQTAAYAMKGEAKWPLVAPRGGKEALQAELVPLTLGSDHQIFADSSFGIPVIYLNDWPDRYIHTSHDTPANIDSTKLKRSAFIAAASGWFLANVTESDARAIWDVVKSRSLARTAAMLNERRGLIPQEAVTRTRFHLWHERALAESMSRFFRVPQDLAVEIWPFYDGLGTLSGGRQPAPPAPTGRVYRRNPSLKGPMTVFGYDYLEAHFGKDKTAALRLLNHKGLRGSGADYAYEALNLVDGRRRTSEIRDALSAIYGPVTLADVEQYLQALESIKVILPRHQDTL